MANKRSGRAVIALLTAGYFAMAAASAAVGMALITVTDLELVDRFHYQALDVSRNRLYLLSLVLGAFPALFILNRLLARLHYPLFRKEEVGFPMNTDVTEEQK